ncbi:transposase [Clostridium kluyveri]|uniref:transposase n=1 Tax=Clostridium kluyveri TaxID=1534 RepID=UPI0022471CC3|nr:transposase [Clostridium kluyveri]UZQ49126.1 transposase [Clostridium kluyveri]
MRKKYSAEFKAKLILTVLKGEGTLNEIARDNGVTVNSINRWKVQAIANFPQLFEESSEVKRMKKKYEARIDEIYKQILKIITGKEF